MPDDQSTTPNEPGSFPLLLCTQVEAFALLVRRETCTLIASMLRTAGNAPAADLVDTDRDFTELSRSLAAIAGPVPAPDHGAGCRVFRCRCGCDQSQACSNCHRCQCWRSDCCVQRKPDAERRRARTSALSTLLAGVGLPMLTELRQTAADAEEAALRRALAHRARLLLPGDARYATAAFYASDSKLCMGHADYSVHDVTLHTQEQKDGSDETIDFDDDVLSRLLGALAELIRPDEGAQLEVDLT
ncbi:hypothetical protein OG458_41600 (plasmid) [Streptomyces sp. NBC_01281]|uniref:hypothetical protein n=1 Tax=Streptomyces sp. NBC_01281 TaxID=2903811 RepID=UPI002E0EFA93|nr:hypothetical protein OG458_41600 [Streptomyces sp. NBC_01281]